MESDGGSALHGYGLRSLGAGATDAALLGPMVGPGFTETNGIAEDPAHDARKQLGQKGIPWIPFMSPLRPF
jgi:hypothetical protein